MTIRVKRYSFHALATLGIFFLFWFLTYMSLSLNADRFAKEFYAQNYQNIESGNGFALIPQLNSLKSQSSIACINGWINGQTFFRSEAGCDAGIISKEISISDKSQNTKVLIKYTLSTEILGYLAAAFIAFVLSANVLLTSAYKIEDLERQSIIVINELAREVAHDIRSPLSTLNSIAHVLKSDNTEQSRLINDVTRRINEIADELLIKSKKFSAKHSSLTAVQTSNLPKVIADLIIQKNIEYKYKKKHTVVVLRPNSIAESTSLKISETSLVRILSNILNNSAEASENGAEIYVEMFQLESICRFIVTDFGRGIPEEILQKLTKSAVSHGKTGGSDGNGIGIFSAAKEIQSVGGELLIDSKLGVGTRVTIEIPIAAR